MAGHRRAKARCPSDSYAPGMTPSVWRDLVPPLIPAQAKPVHDDAPLTQTCSFLCDAGGPVRPYMKTKSDPGESTMTHRAALLIAAALAFAPFAAHAEPAVTIPPPAAEAPAQSGDSRPPCSRADASGNSGRVPARQRRHQCRVRLCRRRAEGRHTRHRQLRPHRPRRSRAGHLGPETDFHTARSCRSYFSVAHDPTQLNRQGLTPAAISLRNFPAERGTAESCEGLYRAARCGPCLQASDRDEETP